MYPVRRAYVRTTDRTDPGVDAAGATGRGARAGDLATRIAAVGYGRERELVPGGHPDHLVGRLLFSHWSPAVLQRVRDGTRRILSRYSALHRRHTRALQYRVRSCHGRADAAVRAASVGRTRGHHGRNRAV